MTNPISLSPRQLWALFAATTRELLWGLRAVSREVDGWRRRALVIPDAPIREDALDSIERKRGHTDGAALFWILPHRHNLSLLRLLVAYQTIWDFLDNVSERGASTDGANGRQLHLALSEALDPGTPISDYYRHHPWKDDGGYLRALVEVCREGCSSLPSYSRVRPLVRGGTARCGIQSVNHDPDRESRDAALKEWAEREFPGEREASWFELSGAASASLTPHVLLALAAEPECEESDIAGACAAYFPWISLVTAMLDSYVDQHEDRALDAHSYIAHYPSPEIAAGRVYSLIRRSVQEVRCLRNGHRHAVIVASMVAMYLSKDSARTPAMRATTRSLASAGGSLTRLLLPILRLWRIAYAQRSV
jgi:tetraprenyl-beta-curcumene synthase